MRSRWLALSDRDLLAECEVDRYRASGPGGQKRNKTESAVRVRHLPSGLAATGTESRSQHENRVRALRRLREKIALELREPFDRSTYQVPAELAALIARPSVTAAERDGGAYLLAAGQLLDLLDGVAGSLRDAADALGLGSAALSRLVSGDERVLRRANELRQAHGLGTVR